MKNYEKIRVMRELNQWSQEQMAEKLNMSVNGYSKIERGKTRLTVARLKQIAEIFHMDIGQLLHDEENGCVVLIGENNTNHGDNHITLYNGSQTEAEIEKLQLIIQYQAELLAQKDRELETLRAVIPLIRKESN